MVLARVCSFVFCSGLFHKDAATSFSLPLSIVPQKRDMLEVLWFNAVRAILPGGEVGPLAHFDRALLLLHLNLVFGINRYGFHGRVQWHLVIRPGYYSFVG